MATPTVFTSSLTATQTANIMMQPQRSDIKYIKYPDDTTLRVTIIIKNLNTNEQCVLTRRQAVTPEFATTWMHSHIGHSYFRNIDFGAISMWPILQCPDGTELFTTCNFPNGAGETLQAMAFLSHATNDANMDTVVVKISAPMMHTTQYQYQISNFREKRFNAIQHAFRAFSKTIPRAIPKVPKPTKVDPLLAALYHNDTISPLGSDTFNIKFAFKMATTEKTAGTHTIPAVLKTLHFLIPGLSSANVAYYDILQGHKSAYVFRLRNLAGWKIIAAVNTTVPSFDITNTVFKKYVPHMERTIAISESILTIFPGNQSALKAKTQELLSAYHEQFIHSLPAGSGLTAKFSKLTSLNFKMDDLISLDEKSWELFVTFQGLKYIHEYFLNSATTLSTDALLRRILYALQTDDPKTIKPFSKHEAALFVDSFFDACEGLADVVMEGIDATNMDNLAIKLLHKEHSRKIFISVDEAIALLTTCIGKDPVHWYENTFPSIFKDEDQLATFMLIRGHEFMEQFKLLVPEELFSTIPAIITTAHNYERRINDARCIFLDFKTSPVTNVHHGLAYALFTGDHITLPNYAAARNANDLADSKKKAKEKKNADKKAARAAPDAADAAGADAADAAGAAATAGADAAAGAAAGVGDADAAAGEGPGVGDPADE